MSFWSGEKLIANPSVVSDFCADRVDANAYNLRMGDSYFVTADKDSNGWQKTERLGEGETFSIPPGQFAFLLTKEIVRVPASAMALISMRTHIKFRGLINVSGFHVDPGYEGHLVYGVFNAGQLPIQLQEGGELFKIWFADLDTTSARTFEGAPINAISGEMVHGMGKEIYSLQSLADKIRELEGSVDKKLAEQRLSIETELASQRPTVDSLHFVWRAIVVGVIVALIFAVLTVAWPKLIELRNFLGQELTNSLATPGSE